MLYIYIHTCDRIYTMSFKSIIKDNDFLHNYYNYDCGVVFSMA